MRYFLALTVTVCLLLPSIQDSCASPARRTLVTLRQPDGKTFRALLRGDENMKILTLPDGTPVVQDRDGFYCYALYDASGALSSTGARADGSAPSSVAGAEIPYGLLSMKYASGNSGENARVPGYRIGKSDGEVRIPVLLVGFRDLPLTYGKEDFDALLNQPGYSLNGATGSAGDYFRYQFMGKVDFRFDVLEPVTLGNTFSYYGRNENSSTSGSDIRAGRMVYDACLLADSNVDFSVYDNDGDGELESIMVIFAGGDEAAGAGSDHIWSKSGFLEDERNMYLECDGIHINCYGCTSELLSDGSAEDPVASIGTFCHEFCHTLGLPDFYDPNGISEALWGTTSIMDRGNLNNQGRTPPNFNAIERHILGISAPDTLAAGEHVLYPVDRDGEYLYYGTENRGEYFLFECRDASGWDSYISGSGLLVYHIDSSYNDVSGVKACDRWLMTGMYANTVNTNAVHQCADLQEADPSAVFSGLDTPQEDIRRVFFPYGENNSFTPESDPAFESWGGTASDISVTGIVFDGAKVSFTVYDNEYSGIPSAMEMTVHEFQDAAIVSWTADTQIPADVSLSDADGVVASLHVDPYEYGKYSVTFENLEPAHLYTVNVGFSIGGITGRVTIRQIDTHPETGNPPYIYMYGIPRNPDGSFPAGTGLPLRLYNSVNAESIVWTMDGKEISAGPGGYYVPEKSGELKARAVFPDGREYRVSKYIEIK